jgi:hypothetical protein
MRKNILYTGVRAFIFSIVLFQCSSIEYKNPIDINGESPDPRVFDNPALLKDSDGNGQADLFDLRDTTFPVITILHGDTVQIMKDDPNGQLSIYLDKSSISVTDAGGGPISILDPVPQVDIFTVQERPYTITYSAQDPSGNKTTAIRYVKIVDAPAVDGPPSLSLSQDTVYVTQGGTYIEPVITAFDIEDGDLRLQVVKDGTVDVNVPGVYVIKYSVTDQGGNSVSIDGYVKVTQEEIIDNTAPVITLLGDDTLFVADGQTIEEFIAAYVEPGYTAVDDRDGDITANVVVSEITQLSVQYWNLTYSVSDAAGNPASPRKRYINTGITAGIPPAITLANADSAYQIIVGGTWTEPGYTAADKEDGNITSQVVVDSTNLTNNINTVGRYKISYSVTNSAGLSTTVYREVQVVESEYDTQKPVITLLGGDTVKVLAGSSTSFVDPGYTATDNRDGDVTENVSVSGTVNMNKLGTYQLSYSVSDRASNRATVYRTVWVVADTNNTDLLVRYNVMSADPLPTAASGTWVIENIDGLGAPDLSYIVTFKLNYSLEQASIWDFRFEYDGPPNSEGLTVSATPLTQTPPTITLTACAVDEMNTTFYVVLMDGNLIWVEENGTFAIIFAPGE